MSQVHLSISLLLGWCSSCSDKRQSRATPCETPPTNQKTTQMPKEQKYEAAMRQLEDIAAKMENGELDIDSLSEQLKTAQKLIKQCKDKLTKTDEDIRKILGADN